MSNIPAERILKKIYIIRDIRIMLDRDLAELYGVETKQLKRQVRRNIERFPEDFMFQLTNEEYTDFLRCQFGTIKRGEHSKYYPMAFTEQGVAMLSSVLNSKQAIKVNIQIMRIFTQMRKMLLSPVELCEMIIDLEKKFATHDKEIETIFNVLKKLIQPDPKRIKRIGFC